MASPRLAASALMRSACALGRVVLPQLHVGVRAVGPGRAARTAASRRRASGTTVHAVKSVPMPMTSAGRTPRARAPRAPRAEGRRGSPRGPGVPSPGRAVARSGSARSSTRVGVVVCGAPSSSPSGTRTTTARPDKVPKSTPITHGSPAGGDVTDHGEECERSHTVVKSRSDFAALPRDPGSAERCGRSDHELRRHRSRPRSPRRRSPLTRSSARGRPRRSPGGPSSAAGRSTAPPGCRRNRRR